MKFTLHNGDSAEVLKQYPDNHFHSVVMDPPYLISFLGKDWDHKDNDLTHVFTECYRVLKPGGYLLSFSAARTYHTLATMIESSGFEIKDQLMWLFASGFPKSQDIGKMIQKKKGVEETKARDDSSPVWVAGGNQDWAFQPNDEIVCTDPEAQQWSGWKTALKPSHEPIVMARKPTKLTFADNCMTHGCGALNIDATRIPYAEKDTYKAGQTIKAPGAVQMDKMYTGDVNHIDDGKGETNHWTAPLEGRYTCNVIGEVEGYQKYFYNPKVSRAERHLGHDIETAVSRVANFYGCTDPDGTEYKNGKECIVPDVGVVHRSDLLSTLKEIHGKDEVAAKSKELRLPYPSSPVEGFQQYVEKLDNANLKEVEVESKHFYAPKVSRAERHLGHDVDGVRFSAESLYGADQGITREYLDDGPKHYSKKAKALKEVEVESKHFYAPKVNRAERHLGMDHTGKGQAIGTFGHDKSAERGDNKAIGNNHPTVKPVELMRYLVKLVTPKGGIVLDPFNGSGSTGMAVVAEGCEYVGIDLDADYIEIARNRIETYIAQDFNIKPPKNPTDKFNELFE